MTSNFSEDSPLYEFSKEQIEAVFAAGKARTCKAGEVIIMEGDSGDSMFFLLEGNAEARLLDGKKVRQYKPGGCFGDLSWVDVGHKRSATIVATTDARLQELNQTSIETLIEVQPRVIVALLRRTCAFLVKSEQEYIDNLSKRNSELEETIKKLAFTSDRLSQEERTARCDALTGLFNRRCLDSELPVFIERAKLIGGNLVLVALDLDHFKPVNDTLGHAAGDAVLRGVGDVLRENLRKSDLPCRTGGDEFIFLIAGCSEEEAKKRAETVRKAIETMSHPGNDQGIRCTATLGGTLFRPDDTPESFMHRADEALYEAKRSGRNQTGWD